MKRYITINPHGNTEYIFNVKFIVDNINYGESVYLTYNDERYHGVITSVDEDSISIVSKSDAVIIIRLSNLYQKFGHDAINKISIVKERVNGNGKYEVTEYTHDDLISTRYNKVIEIDTDIISDNRFLLVKLKSTNNNNIRLLKIRDTHTDECKFIIRDGHTTTPTKMRCCYILPETMACQFNAIPYEKLSNDYELIASFDTYDEFEKFLKTKLGIE